MKYFLLLLAMLSGAAHAETRFFTPGSLQTILADRAGKPFILSLWSNACAHCPAELKNLGELARKHPGVDIVLVATDTPDEAQQLEKLAQSYGLGKTEQWVFDDPQPEKLRFEIDRRWYGELPRTYCFNAKHRREGHSGAIPLERLESWVGEHVK